MSICKALTIIKCSSYIHVIKLYMIVYDSYHPMKIQFRILFRTSCQNKAMVEKLPVIKTKNFFWWYLLNCENLEN